MELRPLTKVPYNTPSAVAIVRCMTCPKKSMYYLAQKGRWTYDPTFMAYYCDTCTQKHAGESSIADIKTWQANQQGTPT